MTAVSDVVFFSHSSDQCWMLCGFVCCSTWATMIASVLPMCVRKCIVGLHLILFARKFVWVVHGEDGTICGSVWRQVESTVLFMFVLCFLARNEVPIILWNTDFSVGAPFCSDKRGASMTERDDTKEVRTLYFYLLSNRGAPKKWINDTCANLLDILGILQQCTPWLVGSPLSKPHSIHKL